ncbi:transposase-like protein [Rhizobium mongolense]|uniref:Transposase-like protein n=1 Tax=Rhizobium mongolense TaxID=57676 RepID=A0ABR6IYF9_9HYPH|nr:transposase-like protein [Rhizobium mongolense]
MSKTTNKFSPEVRARVVRMVLDHEGEYSSRWAAVLSIAAKIDCTAQTLNEWVKKAEVDDGSRPGLPKRRRREDEGSRAGEPGASSGQ